MQCLAFSEAVQLKLEELTSIGWSPGPVQPWKPYSKEAPIAISERE